MKRFSIITVVYNDLTGLKETYRSVASQHFRNFEWIIVDGASNDGTAEFVQSLSEEYLVVISEKDNGIYDAMNKGIDLASGEYLEFLNAGDTLVSSNTLELVDCHLRNLGIMPAMVFGIAYLVFPSGVHRLRRWKRIEKYIWHGLPANHQATFFKRTEVSSIHYDTSYKICGDYYLVASLYKRFVPVSYISELLVSFRVGDASYQNKKSLFLEPYRIQKDVLSIPLLCRWLSFIKRAISTAGFIFWSNSFVKGKSVSTRHR